ncbi:hypothetical protein WES_02487 [Escherichia sp. KTE31]|nr:hypothetical protein WEW_01042 [Escherichia coli KTE33]EOU80102.1 hypothetical protein WES_02487 [Escherichia sp. KTE31]
MENTWQKLLYYNNNSFTMTEENTHENQWCK